jgi:hypothetical protein
MEWIVLIGLAVWGIRKGLRAVSLLGKMKSLWLTIILGILAALLSAWEPSPPKTAIIQGFPQVIQPEFPAQAKP